MNETTKNLLNFDPISTAEDLIGKPHEKWDIETEGIAALGLAAKASEVKRDHLKNIGDTYFGITWNDFIEIAKAYGFKSGYRQKFKGVSYSEKQIEEEEIIFFHEEKGLILYAESFGGESVNSAKVYGEIKIGDKPDENQWEALNGCSYGGKGNGTMYFNVDVRQGFVFHLDSISEVFEFSKSWSKVQFLWLLNYMDTKDKNYSYEKINKQKLDACTPEVRKIIFG